MTHVSAFGRALCRVGTDQHDERDVLVPSEQATCPACIARLRSRVIRPCRTCAWLATREA